MICHGPPPPPITRLQELHRKTSAARSVQVAGVVPSRLNPAQAGSGRGSRAGNSSLANLGKWRCNGGTMARPVAHLANLDLNLLVALRELVRERSVTRAAERLGVTQPAASAALSRLRRH